MLHAKFKSIEGIVFGHSEGILDLFFSVEQSSSKVIK